MIAPQTLDAVLRSGATALADSLVLGSALALLAWILIGLLRQRPAIRFTVLFSALLATASLPIVRILFDSLHSTSASATLLHVADEWAPWVVATWAVLAFAGLVRVGIGIVSLRRLRRTCKVIDPSELGTEIAAAVAAGRRNAEVLISDGITVPAAIGLWRPAVILPAWVRQEMTLPELRDVILHELSHLERRDDWTNLLQRLAKALLFFHPAVWWLETKLSLEREMACDDAVLRRSPDARGYAECLARLAEKTFLRRGLVMAQAAVSRIRQTSHRVARILQRNTTNTPSRRWSGAVAAVVAVIGIGAVSRVPLVFSFDAGSASSKTAPPIAAPGLPMAGVQSINAAWHGPEHQIRGAKPLVKTAVHRSVRRAVPQDSARLVQTSFGISDGNAVQQTVLIVVVSNGDPVAVWHITTWQYSPSRQVVSARKTT